MLNTDVYLHNTGVNVGRQGVTRCYLPTLTGRHVHVQADTWRSLDVHGDRVDIVKTVKAPLFDII